MINKAMIRYIKKRLGPEGLQFFRDLHKKYGKVDVCYRVGKIPHPVHLREGMVVRNYLRESGLCRNWTAHDYDNNWSEVVERALFWSP